MKRFFVSLVATLLCGLCLAQTVLDPYKEIRYCGPPKRDAGGEILRDSKVITAYRKVHKCPSTGKYTGACPDYALNHMVPLACGGCDAVWNMSWMRNDIKALEDRVERQIFAADPPIADTDACHFKVTP